MKEIKKLFLFIWFLIGIILSIPAILFIWISHYFGLKQVIKEEIKDDKNKE